MKLPRDVIVNDVAAFFVLLKQAVRDTLFG